MTYLIAVIGILLIVPFPVIGALMFAFALLVHNEGLVSPVGEVAEMLLFYAAAIGIVVVCLV